MTKNDIHVQFTQLTIESRIQDLFMLNPTQSLFFVAAMSRTSDLVDDDPCLDAESIICCMGLTKDCLSGFCFAPFLWDELFSYLLQQRISETESEFEEETRLLLSSSLIRST